MSILCLPSYVATPSPLTLRFFFFQCSADHRDLHSFPTRRSSDLFEETLEVLLGAWTNERFAYRGRRSEEHTSELQSPYDLVCRLLLEKKKKKKKKKYT